MARIILGAIVGFIIWTIFLLVSDQLWTLFSPDWYGKFQTDFQAALESKTLFEPDATILIIAVIRSAIFSFATGYIAALIAGEHFKSPLLLGIFLLAFGAFIHSMILNNVPVWYHLSILLPLIPLVLLGGKLWQPRLNLIGENK